VYSKSEKQMKQAGKSSANDTGCGTVLGARVVPGYATACCILMPDQRTK
jgi:hypothetical protein